MSTADQIRVAELTGAARHHAKWHPLTADDVRHRHYGM
jgi:hypothetical protein